MTCAPSLLKFLGIKLSLEIVKPKAFVILRQGFETGEKLEKELKTWVQDRMAKYKYPRWIEFVKELPKSSTGKIQRFKLRKKK